MSHAKHEAEAMLVFAKRAAEALASCGLEEPSVNLGRKVPVETFRELAALLDAKPADELRRVYGNERAFCVESWICVVLSGGVNLHAGTTRPAEMADFAFGAEVAS